MDEDTEQAAWGEQELQERHRREDDALKAHAQLLEDFRRENREFEAFMQEHRV